MLACDRFQRLSVLGALVLGGFLTIETDMDKLYGASFSNGSPLKEIMLQCQISGMVTDGSDGLPVENAKVSLLDPSTRDVLFTDIYTNASGILDI